MRSSNTNSQPTMPTSDAPLTSSGFPYPYSAYLRHGSRIGNIYESEVLRVIEDYGCDEENHKKYFEDLFPSDFGKLLSGTHFFEDYEGLVNPKEWMDCYKALKVLEDVDVSSPENPFRSRDAATKRRIRMARKAIKKMYEYLLKLNRAAFRASTLRIPKLRRRISSAGSLEELGWLAVFKYIPATSHAGSERVELLKSILAKAEELVHVELSEDEFKHLQHRLDAHYDLAEYKHLLKQLLSYVHHRVNFCPQLPDRNTVDRTVMDIDKINPAWGVAFVLNKLDYYDTHKLFLFYEVEDVIRARLGIDVDAPLPWMLA